MVTDLPLAQGITGPSREEFILDARAAAREDAITELAPGRLRYRLSYPAADMGEAESLSWRLRAGDRREIRADIGWTYVDARMIEVIYPANLDRGGLFEFTYTARDPMVMGLGLAAIRDTVSALRHGAGPLRGIRRALGFGLSQSGRVLRDFLREGFNEDLYGRPVFDAVIPIIAGSRGAFLNMPFAQPGRFAASTRITITPATSSPSPIRRCTIRFRGAGTASSRAPKPAGRCQRSCRWTRIPNSGRPGPRWS